MSTPDGRMVEVLVAHRTWTSHQYGNQDREWSCIPCGHSGVLQSGDLATDAHRAHQATALTEAGFGHVADAKADALREAADALEDHTVCSCEPDSHLAFVAGPDWLRDRAARIETEESQ